MRLFGGDRGLRYWARWGRSAAGWLRLRDAVPGKFAGVVRCGRPFAVYLSRGGEWLSWCGYVHPVEGLEDGYYGMLDERDIGTSTAWVAALSDLFSHGPSSRDLPFDDAGIAWDDPASRPEAVRMCGFDIHAMRVLRHALSHGSEGGVLFLSGSASSGWHAGAWNPAVLTVCTVDGRVSPDTYVPLCGWEIAYGKEVMRVLSVWSDYLGRPPDASVYLLPSGDGRLSVTLPSSVGLSFGVRLSGKLIPGYDIRSEDFLPSSFPHVFPDGGSIPVVSRLDAGHAAGFLRALPCDTSSDWAVLRVLPRSGAELLVYDNARKAAERAEPSVVMKLGHGSPSVLEGLSLPLPLSAFYSALLTVASAGRSGEAALAVCGRVESPLVVFRTEDFRRRPVVCYVLTGWS